MKKLWKPLTALFAPTAAVALGIFLAGCSTFDPVKAWEPYVWDEPEFVIINLPQKLTQAVCLGGKELPPQLEAVWKILACVQELGPMERGQACVIHISSDIDIRLYQKVLRHEKAHCRGWEHGQPKPEGAFG